MAGATSEAFDPVEIAKQDIGSSRRLIAASLDDLSAHHSWLETYHRDERLRAERLRRREILQRLELAYRRTRNKAQLAARTSYVTSHGGMGGLKTAYTYATRCDINCRRLALVPRPHSPPCA
jgi:predicted deacetylase